MKPLATVHWTVNGKEFTEPIHTEADLIALTASLRNSGVSYHTCMTSLNHRIPSNKSKPIREVV